MGKRRRIFDEPKYEINLESKDTVLIRQEHKSPLGQFLKRIALATIIVVAVIFLGGLVFNMVASLFYPTQIFLTVSHNTDNEQLSRDELEKINIYIDDSSTPIQTRMTPAGLSFKFRKRGDHIIGIENINSRYDSIAFAKEHVLLDSLDIFKRKQIAQKDVDTFVFHRIVSDQDIQSTRFLSFLTRQPRTHLGHVFLSHTTQSSIIIADATCGKNVANDSPLLRDFQGSLYKNLAKFSPHVDSFSGIQHKIEFPKFNNLNWYSESIRNHRFQYAETVNKKLTSSIFILPYVYKDQNGKALANLVLAFANIGDITFEPIEIRKISLDSVEPLPENAAVFSIIQAYLSLYDSYIYAGSDASMINAFIQICNETPHTDPVARLGNRIVRTTLAPKTTSIVYTLDEFFAKIEKMDCLALYNELSEFWVNDPYQLQAITDFNIQEKEVVRAIIKWSLALKENEHECAENDWPSNAQRLAFFSAIKKVIDTTSSLSWLQGDALYGVLIIEINELQTN